MRDEGFHPCSLSCFQSVKSNCHLDTFLLLFLMSYMIVVIKRRTMLYINVSDVYENCSLSVWDCINLFDFKNISSPTDFSDDLIIPCKCIQSL